MTQIELTCSASATGFRNTTRESQSLFLGGTSLAVRYGLGTLVSMGNMLVLTWWIGPHAYGVFVTAIGLSAFCSTLSRVGVDVYLVRREKHPDLSVYGCATTLVIAASTALTAISIALIPLLTRWYGSREFVLPYLVLLINVPVTGLIGVPTAKLEREMKFSKLAAIELAGQTIGFVIALLFAWRGFGLWAAVAGQLIWQVFILVSTFGSAHMRPTLNFERRETAAMLRYGLSVTASMRSWQLRTLVNPLLVARFAGPEAVAFVALAIRVAEALGSIRLAAGRLATAALSRVQNEQERFRGMLEQALFVQVITLGPLLVSFALLGTIVVHRVLGERWLPMLAVFPFVAAGVLINSVFNLQASALLVLGHPWAVMRSYVAHAALLAAGAALLVPRQGIVGYGWAELIACSAYVLIYAATSRRAPVSYRKLAPAVVLFVAVLFAPSVKTAGAMSPASRGSQPIPSRFFGMHFRLDKIRWPSVPFGSLRLWDTDTCWQNLNPSPRVIDFSTLDNYLSAAREHGVTDIVLTLGGTPRWASAEPNNQRCDFSEVAPGTCAPPRDLNIDGSGPNQYWRNFLYALGIHLRTLPPRFAPVSYFSVWNEFTRGRESKRASWVGTNEQLVRMIFDANCVLIGRAAPGESCTAAAMHVPAVGLLPGTKSLTPDAVPLSADMQRFERLLSSQNALNAVDVIAVHAYPDQDGDTEFLENDQPALARQWDRTQRLLADSARSLPVWSTEGSWGDTAHNLPDPDMQAAFIARYFLLGWSLGFDRMYWYAADNSWGRLIYTKGIAGCDDHDSREGCPTKAAAAFTETYRWMVGNRMSELCAPSKRIWTCGLTKPDGARMLAVWDASQTCLHGYCTTTSFTYPIRYLRYFTLDGPTSIALTGGTVRIGAKPILLSE